MNLLSRLAASEQLIELYTNTKKEPIVVNRLKKFLRQPIKYLYQNAVKVGLGNADWPVRTFWGQNLLLPISDENAVLIYYCGSLGFGESAFTRFLIENTSKNDVFYDIGANYGYYSSLASTLGAEVHSFEPNPSVLPYTR